MSKKIIRFFSKHILIIILGLAASKLIFAISQPGSTPIRSSTDVFAQSSWYNTFDYNGSTYAWSHAFDSTVKWDTIIPGHRYSENYTPDGNHGEKGQNWCNALIQSGNNVYDKNYNDWFLPNFGEINAGLSYEALPDRSEISCDCCESPTDCHPNYKQQTGQCWNMQARALWSSSSCGNVSRAYHFHKSTVIDTYAQAVTNCPEGENYCCLEKSGYSSYHLCPQARCVRIISGEPSPITPSPSPSPEPIAPQCYQIKALDLNNNVITNYDQMQKDDKVKFECLATDPDNTIEGYQFRILADSSWNESYTEIQQTQIGVENISETIELSEFANYLIQCRVCIAIDNQNADAVCHSWEPL